MSLNALKPIVSALQALWRHVGRIDLRVILLFCGLTLSIFSAKPPWLSQLDFRLLQFSSLFLSAPRGTSDIAVITVPKEEISLWQSDIHGGKLAALLSNVLHASPTTIGILLDNPLNLSKLEAEAVIEGLLRKGNKLTPESKKQAKEIVQRKQFLIQYLHDERVVLGSANAATHAEPLAVDLGVLKKLPAALQFLIWPLYREVSAVKISAHSADPTKHFPFQFNSQLPQQQLIFGNPFQAAYSTFFTKYFITAQKFSGYDIGKLKWQADTGLSYLNALLPASPTGSFVGLHSLRQGLMPAIETIPLEEALSRGAFPKYIFIAEQSHSQALKMATDFYSAAHEHTIFQPWWLPFIEKFLLLATTLYLFFALPKISFKTAIITTAVSSLILISTQIIAVLSHKLLLVFTLNVAWLILGHLFMEMWKQRSQRWQTLQSREVKITLQHADLLFEKGSYGRLEEVLTEAATSPQILQRYYDLARVYSERKQYISAINTLKAIVARQKGYKDTEQKIQALEAVVGPPPETAETQSSPSLPAKTSKILNTPKIDRQELGRYKVKEELGRGAMGVVYLGFDPKISRRVAIKTFHYNQFQPQQVEELKSRFYREAEAAGRLNHPSIVSVYDVGEEDDLAFIAMDFAAGESLNHFAIDTNLLPVFEVYRTICEVAKALDYAHNNQIVHRDIKPGNIMYSPSPFQVKVTDFGIARLVDDSRTSTGEILGSPLYMSPEQLKGKKVNGSSDIFSLGVTFYQLLTGALPFSGENLAALTYEIIHGKHKGVRAVRKELPVSASRIINQCLQKSPEDRYASAGELALAINKAIRRDFAQQAKRSGYI